MAQEGPDLERVDVIGCLSQRSRIERLQAMADSWTRERVARLPGDAFGLPATLIVLGDGDGERIRELGFFNAGPRGTLTSLIPQQGIVRLLREGGASAAALIAPQSRDVVALQIADLDHEETLTARIVRPAQGPATIDKWDFAPSRWPLRLREILSSVRAFTPGVPAGAMAGDGAAPARLTREGASPARRGLVRELREALGQPSAAPSWLQ
jgi:hypothetical protein